LVTTAVRKTVCPVSRLSSPEKAPVPEAGDDDVTVCAAAHDVALALDDQIEGRIDLPGAIQDLAAGQWTLDAERPELVDLLSGELGRCHGVQLVINRAVAHGCDGAGGASSSSNKRSSA
jgi:hypothetical protein